MMICPQCGKEYTLPTCRCGYDGTRDCAAFPTLMRVTEADWRQRVPWDACLREVTRLLEQAESDLRAHPPKERSEAMEVVTKFRFLQEQRLSEMCGLIEPVPCDLTAVHQTISSGEYHSLGLRRDGTVAACGSNGVGQCNVDGWTGIVSVSAGRFHSLGLRRDGTVVACGLNDDGQCDVDGWTDIVAVSAGWCRSLGLRRDGTVVYCGRSALGKYNVGTWRDIAAISTGGYHSIGLRRDGTVVPSDMDPVFSYGEGDVRRWQDIRVSE